MELIAPEVAAHLTRLVPPRPPELAAMEAEAARTGFPIIGPAAGQLCYLLARALGARRIFELGSGFGYSTAWFARAVAENGGGEVHHVVWDAELSRRAGAHLAALGLLEHVRFHVGEAVATLRGVAGPFDLVFNDIDKEGYPASLPVIAERLRPGGLLIVDNALWLGRPFDESDRSPATEGVRELTRRLTTDPGWITSLAPIRDGLLIALRAPAR
ncbi:MAG TPA: O-methyltransferase [Gemmatimonadaceae bacterium]|nr:O-methyltransferase [Gemmatimonadaceae bacterium]